MKEMQELVSVTDLRRLVDDLKEKRPDIGIRFRMIGELWAQNFARIVLVSDKGIVLSDENTGKLFALPDLSAVMQFELDGPFHNFQPHNHYDVRAIPVH